MVKKKAIKKRSVQEIITQQGLELIHIHGVNWQKRINFDKSFANKMIEVKTRPIRTLHLRDLEEEFGTYYERKDLQDIKMVFHDDVDEDGFNVNIMLDIDDVEDTITLNTQYYVLVFWIARGLER